MILGTAAFLLESSRYNIYFRVMKTFERHNGTRNLKRNLLNLNLQKRIRPPNLASAMSRTSWRAKPAHDDRLVRSAKPETLPADAHETGQRKPKMEQADAHDAGPVGAQSPSRNQLMLMMLRLLVRKAQSATS